MKFGVKIQGTGCPAIDGRWLRGPRSPSDVRKLGYSFTDQPEEAWPFATAGEATRKAGVIARHMSSGASVEEIR